MRQRQYVPTDTGEVHSAAKQGNEHREEKITEAWRGPDQRPVGASGSVCGSSGHGDVIVYCFQPAVFSRELVTWFQRVFLSETIMGKELQGAVRVGRQRHQGKILLETNELIFRGTDYRLKITFAEMRDVQAKNGQLRIATNDDVLTFEVGTAAEKWREKIVTPKPNGQKICVKQEAMA